MNNTTTPVERDDTTTCTKRSINEQEVIYYNFVSAPQC
jgi:hypothetical protein